MAGVQREMLVLGEAGYKEVTLLGQNVDAYGRDLPGAADDGAPLCHLLATTCLLCEQGLGEECAVLICCDLLFMSYVAPLLDPS